MILLFTPQESPRFKYIARFLFTSVLGVPIFITSKPEEFKNSILPKINYSHKKLDGIAIIPASLLFEQNIREFSPEYANFNNFPLLFPVSQSSSLPFDPFAASFYMLSRYEEYHIKSTDKHNRMLPNQTISFKNNFLEIPVVDNWAMMLRQLIEKNYPGYKFPERKYRFIPTIDVDIAFAYKYRGFLRTTGAILKSFVRNDRNDNRRRFQTLFQKQPDPYDTFSLINHWHMQYNLTPRFFFQVGHYSRFDKNISPNHTAIQQLIKETQANSPIGIHPSYQSNYNKQNLKHEVETLRKISGSNISKSRQHFLILKFPETYQHLIDLGITEDYTMGYAHLPGFRAGTCTPFPFYDLTKESETALMIYPFQVMDGTLNQYLKLYPLEAIECIRRLNNEVRKVNGIFISLWHNESLSEIRNWKNWREVYEALLKIAS